MTLAFWRRPAPPQFDYLGWCSDRQRAARAFGGEMAGWGEPIDTMRAAMELPERWQRTSQRAWQQILALCARMVVPEAPGSFVVTSTTQGPAYYTQPWAPFDPSGANTGNPIHDEALRNARGETERWTS